MLIWIKDSIPSHWKIGAKLKTPFGTYRLLEVYAETKCIVVRKWKWYDEIAYAYYIAKLIFLNIKVCIVGE